MERISKEIISEFIKKSKIDLVATQSKLCIPVINRIFLKMSVGIKFSAIKVSNNIICDGHHRYFASLLANFPLERIPGLVPSSTTEFTWDNVIFEEDDWDTSAKIAMLNDQDADYNNMSIVIMRFLTFYSRLCY